MMMSGEKKTKCNTNCCVPQCHSKASKDPQLSFHKFPHDNETAVIINLHNVKETVDRRKEWLWRFRIGKKVSNRMVVCSKHFRKDDFIPGPGRDGKTRHKARLKRIAVPTLFLPDKKGEVERRNEEVRGRQERVIQNPPEDEVSNETDDIIGNFHAFTKNILKCDLNFGFKSSLADNCVLFYKLSDEDCLQHFVTFKVFNDFSLEIWHEDNLLPIELFKWIFENNCKLKKWSQLHCLVDYLNSYF